MVSRSLASSIHNTAPASRHAHHAPPPNPQRGRADLDRASLSSATATLCEEPVKVVPVAVPSSTPDQLALAAHQAALINQFFGGGRYEEHRLALDVQPSHEARAQKKAKRHADGKPRSWSKRLFTLGWVRHSVPTTMGDRDGHPPSDSEESDVSEGFGGSDAGSRRAYAQRPSHSSDGSSVGEALRMGAGCPDYRDYRAGGGLGVDGALRARRKNAL